MSLTDEELKKIAKEFVKKDNSRTGRPRTHSSG